MNIVDLWRERHRFCGDTPPPIEDLAEARYVLANHARHGGSCLQYLAAQQRAFSEVRA
ncbi:hypothetical protein [Nocardia wallacei]|uniref:hypothetical protein n=1 Tax=Nocardia wallacei TaxID=480035 RepID=UPI0024549E21|nr:hypothetical protein [Nocardia wallacei]